MSYSKEDGLLSLIPIDVYESVSPYYIIVDYVKTGNSQPNDVKGARRCGSTGPNEG